MAASYLHHIGLLTLEGVLVTWVLLVLYRLRRHYGLVLVALFLGALSVLGTALSQTVMVPILPGIEVSPGWTVLFPAVVVGVLLVFIRDSANETRRLIYGVVGVNIVISVLLAVLRIHGLGGDEVAVLDARVLLVATLALAIDSVFLVLGYEFLSRLLQRWVLLRLVVALAITMCLDALLFATGAFAELPEYPDILVSVLVGKGFAAVLYAVLLWIYLRAFESPHFLDPRDELSISEILDILTHQESFESVRRRAVYDPVTKVYNRAVFDDVLPTELRRGRRFDRPVSLLMVQVIDLEAFEQQHGRDETERALRAVVGALHNTVRASDIPCRVDLARFALIMPGADAATVLAAAQRLQKRVEEFCRTADPPIAGGGVSVATGGVCYPEEATSFSALIGKCEQRLTASQVT